MAMAQSAVASYRVFILPASRCAEINKITRAPKSKKRK
ncbi:hypothetical protein [Klebsiella pneumoniae ISC21]|nr:hypothetical protein [Klebsiella pneumoniae ISC21]